MCTKADEAEIFRFLAFEGAGEDIPSSLGDGTWNIITGAMSESETSCLTILVLVWEARRDKEKQGLATRSVSYNQETLPSFFLPLLVVTKVNILAAAEG